MKTGLATCSRTWLLLMATTIPPSHTHTNFKLPEVTYICQDSDTMCDVKKRLTKEVVESARESHMAPSTPVVAVNVDDYKMPYKWQSPQLQGQTDVEDEVDEEFAWWSKAKA